MSEDLKKTIAAYIIAWRKMSRVYAAISIFLRGTLIVFSALVAASVGGIGAGRLLSNVWIALLSVYVASGTAVEAWLKPREKWRGFMTDCEDAEALLILLANTTDAKQVEALRVEFQRILERHREKNVF